MHIWRLVRNLVALAAFCGVLASPAMAQNAVPEPGSTSEYDAAMDLLWEVDGAGLGTLGPGGAMQHPKLARLVTLFKQACAKGDAAACERVGIDIRFGNQLTGSANDSRPYYIRRAVNLYSARCKAVGPRDLEDCSSLAKFLQDLPTTDKSAPADLQVPGLDQLVVNGAAPLIDMCVANSESETCLLTTKALKNVAPTARQASLQKICKAGYGLVCESVGQRSPERLAEIAKLQPECNRGLAASCTALTKIYYGSRTTFPADLPLAVALGRKACAGKDGSGCFMVGLILWRPDPTTAALRDPPGAADAFGQACKLGGQSGPMSCSAEQQLRAQLAKQAAEPAP